MEGVRSDASCIHREWLLDASCTYFWNVSSVKAIIDSVRLVLNFQLYKPVISLDGTRCPDKDHCKTEYESRRGIFNQERDPCRGRRVVCRGEHGQIHTQLLLQHPLLPNNRTIARNVPCLRRNWCARKIGLNALMGLDFKHTTYLRKRS